MICACLTELPVEFITPLGDHTVVEKQSITLECEVSKPDRQATWMRAGTVLEPSDRIEIRVEGTKHFLTIKNCTLEDEAMYTIKVEEAESTGKLLVEGQFMLCHQT